jgi:hypothetical protein
MLTLLGQTPAEPTVTFIAVPEAESPVMHVRNALMLLSLLREMSPATWALNPEFERAQRRAEAARVILDHSGPAAYAALHVQRAIEALLAAAVDWEVVSILPNTMARLFAAWFALLAILDQQ